MKDHLLQVKIAIDFYFQSYENIVLISDFHIMLCYVMLCGSYLPSVVYNFVMIAE